MRFAAWPILLGLVPLLLLRWRMNLLTLSEAEARSMELLDGDVAEFGTYDEENGLRFAAGIGLEALRPMLLSRAVYQKGEPSWYVEPIARAGRVYLFGGGHVGKELVPVLAHVGFRVTVFDNREDFAKAENYPAAEEVVFGDFEKVGEKISITADDCVVIMG